LFGYKLRLYGVKKAQFILGFFFICLPYLASSDTLDRSEFHPKKEDLIRLSSSTQWTRVLGFFDENWINKDQKFFLTDTNEFSPLNELEETISEYIKFSTNKSDFFCKNPARAVFLTHHLPQLPKFKFERCIEYSKWSKNGEIESISLLYVTGYLKNPASFFGHTLLKFNGEKGQENFGLLDSSLNYGAHTNNDAALPYVVRGLTGGYSASLVEEKFFRLSAEYQELQKRDIYEYKLQLSEYQKWLIIAYSFEMTNKEFIYYFLADNCAFRLNLILGLALESDPMPQLPWSAPIDLLMGITQTGIIESITYHPSQTSRTISAIDTLSVPDKQDFTVATESILRSKQDLEYSMPVKLAILETLNYLKIDAFKHDDSSVIETIDEERKGILLSLEQEKVTERTLETPSNYPHEINKPTLLRYGFRRTGNNDPIISLQLRAANFELLDIDRTRKTNSEFIFLSPKIAIQNQKVRLDELTLFKVLSLNDSKIVIPGDTNFAWGVEVGKFNLSENCDHCNVLQATGTLGKAFNLDNNISIYALVNVSMHQSKLNAGNFSLSTQAGLLYTLGSSKLNLDLKKIEYKGDNYFDDEVFSIAYQFNFNNDFSFAVKGENAINHWSFGLEINQYF
jgi:hypothetical protein